MRILMVSHGYPPTLSGVTLVVQKLARAMVRRGHHVTVVTSSDAGETYEAEDEGVRLIRVHGGLNPFWKEAPIPFISHGDLQDIVEDVQPDILHAHESGPLGLQLARLETEPDVPRVISCYYVPRFAARYLAWNGEPSEIVESIVRSYSIWLFNHFRCVVFSTAAHRQFFAGDELVVPTTVISNGVDVRRYSPAGGCDEGVEAKYDLPAGPRILFVSRLAKDKEIDVLLSSMRSLDPALGAQLLLVGRGDDEPRLQEITDELDLRDRVRFLGFVPEEDLPALYRASSLFAIASICEVQSLPTLQAAATGLPVVAADAVALPELVHHGVNGFLVPPGKPEAFALAMEELLRDQALAARMGTASRAIAQEHAEDRTFDQYEELWLQTAREHDNPRQPSVITPRAH
ncbi:MAG: glycosyltransferase [Anaerolineae bacterium]|nr:glycosyltransferase [Anaerolineae bacterium]